MAVIYYFLLTAEALTIPNIAIIRAAFLVAFVSLG